MICLLLALISGALAAWFSNPFAGLAVGILIYTVCRLTHKRQSRQPNHSSSMHDTVNSSSSDTSSSWIGGGLFSGAGAVGNWDTADSPDGDSGSDSGGD